MATALFIVFGAALFLTCLRARWFLGLKQWARIALMTTIGVVGALGAWRAAVDAQRVEPVWLDVGTGIKPLAVPIRVLLPPDLDTYAPVVRAAMRLWNDQAGCAVFAETDAAYDVRIVFLRDEPCDGATADPGKNVAASTYFCANGGIDIAVQRLDEIQGAYVAFAHELGHVLGLAHDPSGLMAPALSPMTLVLPSDKDARAVRDRYCQGGH